MKSRMGTPLQQDKTSKKQLKLFEELLKRLINQPKILKCSEISKVNKIFTETNKIQLHPNGYEIQQIQMFTSNSYNDSLYMQWITSAVFDNMCVHNNG